MTNVQTGWMHEHVCIDPTIVRVSSSKGRKGGEGEGGGAKCTLVISVYAKTCSCMPHSMTESLRGVTSFQGPPFKKPVNEATARRGLHICWPATKSGVLFPQTIPLLQSKF